jgi:hypothetical protein
MGLTAIGPLTQDCVTDLFVKKIVGLVVGILAYYLRKSRVHRQLTIN